MRATVVRGGGVGITEHDGLRRIGAVAIGIGGAEDGDGFGAQSDSEMERAGVPADNALRALQQGHEGAEFAVVDDRFGTAAGGVHFPGEGFFAGAVINHTTKVQVFEDFLAEGAEALGGPAFGAPAAAGAEDDVFPYAGSSDVCADAPAVHVADAEMDGSDGLRGAGTEREFAILIGNVRGFWGDAIGVQDGDAKFPDGGGREADAQGDAGKKREERGFPEALVVEGSIEAARANSGDDGADIGEVAGIHGPDFGGELRGGDEIHPAGMGEPDDFGARKCGAKSGDGGKGVDDIAERAEADDEDTRLRHAEPCGSCRRASAWSGLSDRRQ